MLRLCPGQCQKERNMGTVLKPGQPEPIAARGRGAEDPFGSNRQADVCGSARHAIAVQVAHV